MLRRGCTYRRHRSGHATSVLLGNVITKGLFSLHDSVNFMSLNKPSELDDSYSAIVQPHPCTVP